MYIRQRRLSIGIWVYDVCSGRYNSFQSADDCHLTSTAESFLRNGCQYGVGYITSTSGLLACSAYPLTSSPIGSRWAILSLLTHTLLKRNIWFHWCVEAFWTKFSNRCYSWGYEVQIAIIGFCYHKWWWIKIRSKETSVLPVSVRP